MGRDICRLHYLFVLYVGSTHMEWENGTQLMHNQHIWATAVWIVDYSRQQHDSVWFETKKNHRKTTNYYCSLAYCLQPITTTYYCTALYGKISIFPYFFFFSFSAHSNRWSRKSLLICFIWIFQNAHATSWIEIGIECNCNGCPSPLPAAHRPNGRTESRRREEREILLWISYEQTIDSHRSSISEKFSFCRVEIGKRRSCGVVLFDVFVVRSLHARYMFLTK